MQSRVQGQERLGRMLVHCRTNRSCGLSSMELLCAYSDRKVNSISNIPRVWLPQRPARNPTLCESSDLRGGPMQAGRPLAVIGNAIHHNWNELYILIFFSKTNLRFLFQGYPL